MLSDPNSLRELVHEIKTPLNAIIGFAEIIDSQLLGPADRHYRTRAAEIVAQAKLLLSAIDDLDFAAKLQADRNRPGSGTDLAMLLEQIAVGDAAGRLGQCAAARAVDRNPQAPLRARAGFGRAAGDSLLRCAVRRPRRTASNSSCMSTTAPAGACCGSARRPSSALATAMRRVVGFGLRLVRGLARIAGGDLTITKARITLALPEL